MRRRGAVLVVTFWLLLVTGAVLLGLNRVAAVSMRRGDAQLEQVKARWLARAAIEKGIEQLVWDVTSYDAMTDYWFDDPISFQAIELIEGSGYHYSLVAPAVQDDQAEAAAYRYGMVDEASKVNANAADGRQLNRLLTADTSVTQALLDWRDGNQRARSGGAEQPAYDALDYPYLVRNGPLRTHAELKLISGMTPELYTGEDVNGNGLLDAREDDGSVNAPDDNADGALDPGWAGHLTVYSYGLNQTLLGTERVNMTDTSTQELVTRLGFSQSLAEKVNDRQNNIDTVFDLIGERGDGRAEEDEVHEITIDWIANQWEQITVEDDERLAGQVNINTASREVLDTVSNLRDAALESLLSLRVEQGGFAGVGELYTLDVVSQRDFRVLAPLVTVKSNVFTAVGVGTTPSGVQHRIRAVIDRGGSSPVILYWQE